ncbi:epoxide hydrolase 1 [Mycobacterium sp. CBMA293]|uniref:epoxide hydrolase family protein n=1 Tax=unclassified Mycolicibacterium TaxID=2636767 RepID=UPI0012DDA9C8|nr:MULTISPECIES: epoxide hydrolase [unclassified Mycolicibacterium]MUL50091.1 epoxide hydrolase 1 [Mycolicibacterium sp. CBMA 360]MUL62552.1 epoxide hydrolase 1 [Mycolicibacterium sp. CBMA 335]MUL69004.1 epoxide hydrolase 1 [Mycolicibacterium sp. CBMA 311]MUL96943.1 epoxide hydrolase 1 [Mycolicibacterium sp. CBMA 230]MUM04019.1 hypothetical protein [Mycolicibacterium sp. CBMA 213]
MSKPYQIRIAPELVEQTRDRIRATRWSAMIPDDRHRYGASVDELRSILSYWSEEYSWPAWEERLNSRPHYLAEIDGVNLHYWHVPGASPGGIPLLLLHGWPGAAVEFWDLIGPLTDPGAHGQPLAPVFDVVIAELPGFGFSGKPREPGWGLSRMADALHTLMHDELGFAKYAVHGEDWGSMIAARLARRHPDVVAAIQITMPYADPPAPNPDWDAYMYGVGGYSHVQDFVPDALTIGMADSPLALAAWVLEKFTSWSDNDGTLASAFSLDVLVTILNFYWLDSSIISSTRIYREVTLEGEDVIGPPQISVPTGICLFPKEPFAAPRENWDAVYNVARVAEFPAGGHFAALERPDDVISEIRQFFPQYLRRRV